MVHSMSSEDGFKRFQTLQNNIGDGYHETTHHCLYIKVHKKSNQNKQITNIKSETKE